MSCSKSHVLNPLLCHKLHMSKDFCLFCLLWSQFREQSLAHLIGTQKIFVEFTKVIVPKRGLWSHCLFSILHHIHISICYWVICMFVRIIKALMNVLHIWFVISSLSFVRNAVFSVVTLTILLDFSRLLLKVMSLLHRIPLLLTLIISL